ncbi:J domain-containing protein [Saccharopolyspora endophytica]|uniref:DnaJ domain-containing protein n=1 Tax=Saccharopolyspora endophytica TaxID=543886 RepID=A0ABS5DMT0_9PSEU|nr:DnaJ domain-containing protein [Saccharopolyspora endophytica]MBQ0927601.1 DnaJ domain-containing protein [Saccharopolyspora endophytica]
MRGVDYYELLGVGSDATPVEIKSAYRTLARSMHPDVGGSDGAFRLLQEAYETLTDPVRRASYDSARRRPVEAEAAPPRRPRRPGGTRRPGRDFGEDPDYVPRMPRVRLDDLDWWDGVDPQARVQYLPVLGPDRMPTFALVGAWSLLLLAGMAVELNAVLMATWLGLLISSGVVIVVLLRRHIGAHREHRMFTAEFGNQRIFGLPDIQHERAQLLTAELCAKYLIRLPGVRVFHGLTWPDSVFEDVHHAVLCGRRLVLVESKSWLPGHYTTDEKGSLWRNGHPFRGGVTRLNEGVANFEALLPEVEVRGAVLIYPSRAGEITTVEQPDEQVVPMTPAQFVKDIGHWLAQDPVTVDRDVFTTVLDQLVD